jgi:predicted N-formylglutamate amidohydrolase
VKLVLSCEHGGNEIPESYKSLFKDAKAALNSHRGLDYGALDLFKYCAALGDYSKFSTISRLLIELNRSKHHPKLFSEFTKILSELEKSKLIEQIYDPYRKEIELEISNLLETGEKLLHLSVHSFTPSLSGQVRNADIGLLYDPSRNSEKAIAKELKQLIKTEIPNFKIRYNYPYLGTADGFTSYLRKKFPENYSGIEIEINQKHAINNKFGESLKIVLFNAIDKLK